MFSTKTLGILALIAAVCFLMLIGLQVAELRGYASASVSAAAGK